MLGLRRFRSLARRRDRPDVVASAGSREVTTGGAVTVRPGERLTGADRHFLLGGNGVLRRTRIPHGPFEDPSTWIDGRSPGQGERTAARVRRGNPARGPPSCRSIDRRVTLCRTDYRSSASRPPWPSPARGTRRSRRSRRRRRPPLLSHAAMLPYPSDDAAPPVAAMRPVIVVAKTRRKLGERNVGDFPGAVPGGL